MLTDFEKVKLEDINFQINNTNEEYKGFENFSKEFIYDFYAQLNKRHEEQERLVRNDTKSK